MKKKVKMCRFGLRKWFWLSVIAQACGDYWLTAHQQQQQRCCAPAEKRV
jgi:hypothetical protein